MSMISEQVKRLRERAKRIIECGFSQDGAARDLNDAADTIEELSKKLAVGNGNWIPCSERLPDSSEDVNITTRSSVVGIGSFFEEANEWMQWYCGGGIAADVIAWMPLPEPYKE